MSQPTRVGVSQQCEAAAWQRLGESEDHQHQHSQFPLTSFPRSTDRSSSRVHCHRIIRHHRSSADDRVLSRPPDPSTPLIDDWTGSINRLITSVHLKRSARKLSLVRFHRRFRSIGIFGIAHHEQTTLLQCSPQGRELRAAGRPQLGIQGS